MPRARRLIAAAPFEPDTLKALGHLFDEVWGSLAPEVGDDPQEIAAARMQLATIIIDLAKIRQLSDLEIAKTAARLMRERPERSEGMPSKQEL
jgi:hypothetical protein